MAQYWFDFEDWPLGAGELGDYLAATGLSTIAQVGVYNNATYADKNYLALLNGGTNNQRRGFVFKTVPDAIDIEMYGVELANEDATNRSDNFRMLARAQASDSNMRSYFTNYLTSPDAIVNVKYDTAYAQLGSSSSITRSNTVKYAKRFQVFGTSPVTLKQKRWVFGDAEPAAWSLEATDSTPSTELQSAGKPGLGFFSFVSQVTQRWLHIGIGTDGDPAPTGPVEGGISAEPFRLRHNPRTNKVIPTLTSPTVTDIGATCVRPRVTKGF